MALHDATDLVNRFAPIVEQLRAEGCPERRILNALFGGAVRILDDFGPVDRKAQLTAMAIILLEADRKPE